MRAPFWLARAFSIGLFAAVSLAARLAQAADAETRPDAVPYRPTVSTPAALSAPLWLEAEFGGLYLRNRPDDDPVRRSSVPYSLKLAFTEDWGVRINGEAVARATATDGTHETGFGDTALIVKRRFAIDASSAFGLEAGAAFPTARHGLSTGSGKTDASVNGIYSADLGAWHTDLNLLNMRFGARQEGQSRLQTLGAASLSHPLDDRWTAAAELSGTRQRGASGTAQVLGALGWAVRRDVVLDIGVAHGLNRATPTWQAFMGATVVVGKL